LLIYLVQELVILCSEIEMHIIDVFGQRMFSLALAMTICIGKVDISLANTASFLALLTLCMQTNLGH